MPMASLTISELDPSVVAQLRLRAAEHGRSLEEEAREILHSAVTQPKRAEAAPNMAERIRRRFEPAGGVDLSIPERAVTREPVDFSGPEYGTFGDE